MNNKATRSSEQSADESSGQLKDNNLIIPAFKWQGEDNCMIGPFKSELHAEQFAGMLAELQEKADFLTAKKYVSQVVSKRNKWFIKVNS